MGTSVHTDFLARSAEGRPTFELTHSTFRNGSTVTTSAHLTDFQKVLESPGDLVDGFEEHAVVRILQTRSERRGGQQTIGVTYGGSRTTGGSSPSIES